MRSTTRVRLYLMLWFTVLLVSISVLTNCDRSSAKPSDASTVGMPTTIHDKYIAAGETVTAKIDSCLVPWGRYQDLLLCENKCD